MHIGIKYVTPILNQREVIYFLIWVHRIFALHIVDFLAKDFLYILLYKMNFMVLFYKTEMLNLKSAIKL